MDEKEIVDTGERGQARFPRPQPQEVAMAGRDPEQSLEWLQHINVYGYKKQETPWDLLGKYEQNQLFPIGVHEFQSEYRSWKGLGQ